MSEIDRSSQSRVLAAKVAYGNLSRDEYNGGLPPQNQLGKSFVGRTQGVSQPLGGHSSKPPRMGRLEDGKGVLSPNSNRVCEKSGTDGKRRNKAFVDPGNQTRNEITSVDKKK